jgi:hypothetical protein
MRRNARYAAAVLPALWLAACATSPTAPATSVATTTMQSAYAVERAYTVAAHAELAAVPAMSAAQKAAMKAADNQAYSAVQLLQVAAPAVADIAAAEAAVSALNATIKGATP